MSCDQLNDTLAWLYGEGDDEQAVHIASCPECLALVEEHEQVLAAVTRAMPVSAMEKGRTGDGGRGSRWRWR